MKRFLRVLAEHAIKIQVILTCVILVMSINSHAASPDCSKQTSQQNSYFAGGDGSQANPYGICNYEQLKMINNYPNAYFQLWSDINASPSHEFEHQWQPLFVNENNPFTGALNGMGHTIDDLYIYRPNEDYVGMFKYCSGCLIENLNITKSRIVGKDDSAALIGHYIVESNWRGSYSYSPMHNITVDAEVVGQESAGGVFGYVYNVGPLLWDRDFAKNNVVFKGHVTNAGPNCQTYNQCSGQWLIGQNDYD